ncbi:cellulose biosynthesis cyclic di-GMP-binding regulatory protein BcsB [Burkholderia ubonensis]|uniref:cellulose biosynthesis cyclic di-GMP-binding regulatory protein BcsB n=1 Tax=Burkholderia ubonensis TaxID=101571 RepID=UPI0009B30AD1|nr:cellulose biosynthesis cyclic di-GMP-binding regulatory protein BcsB [Burkholderia ubonensis]
MTKQAGKHIDGRGLTQPARHTLANVSGHAWAQGGRGRLDWLPRCAAAQPSVLGRWIVQLCAAMLMTAIANTGAGAPLHGKTDAPAASSSKARETSDAGKLSAGPAVPLDPRATEPAPFATPTTTPIAVPPKLIGTRTPTTADPGVWIPGGRRQTLRFSDLGALDPLQLHGTEGENGIAFSVRNDEVVTSATLHLIYSYSPALLPQTSQLKVLVNSEVAATLPLPHNQAGITLVRDIPIDARFITEFNHLNIQLVGHYTPRCEDPANSSLWATVSNASALDLTYASLPVKADLAALPQPFFDHRDVRRLELPFVFAAPPGQATLEAAGAVAAWFGALASYRGALFPARINTLPASGNAVVFATPDHAPVGVSLPPVSGPTLAVVDRPAPAYGKVLLVLGRDESDLKTAAAALTIGQNTLSGASAAIERLTTLAPRVPYDAPNWLPTTRPVRLGELAEARELNVQGYSADAIRINLRVPPDLFMWGSRGAPIDLRYRYTVRPSPDRSSLNISINDGFVRSLPIPAVATSTFDLGRYFSHIAPDRTAAGRAEIDVPPFLLAPRSQLRLHFYYDIPNTGECHSRLLDNVAGSIDPNSTIDLSGYAHYIALPDLAVFANSGFPYTRMADLSQTAVVMPDDANTADYSLYLLIMGRLGASTGYPATGVTVTTAGEVDRYADKDVLIVGAPGRQPLLQRWGKFMPFSSDADAQTFTLSDVALKLNTWWHNAQGIERPAARADLTVVGTHGGALIAAFESPLAPSRSAIALIAAEGASSENLTAALLDADMLPSIQGAMNVIQGRTVTVTSNGTPYYVGHLSPIEYMRWILSSHPLLLALGGIAAALIAAALFFRLLRSVAARRFKE